MSEHFPGRCTCGAVHYELTARPLFVHACHCTWCQRETGSAFALNALIETAHLRVTKGAPTAVNTPSNSGKGQVIYRCPTCQVALWSVYSGAGPIFSFVRVGSLENPAACPPDIHIFTDSKLPWVALPEGVPKVPDYYDRKQYWPDWALVRRQKAIDGQAGASPALP